MNVLVARRQLTLALDMKNSFRMKATTQPIVTDMEGKGGEGDQHYMSWKKGSGEGKTITSGLFVNMSLCCHTSLLSFLLCVCVSVCVGLFQKGLWHNSSLTLDSTCNLVCNE